MAQEAFEQLTNEWVALSDKITVDEDANYYIQNRGADILLAQEAGETPQADNVNGTLIKPYEQAKYKANGGDLYLRAYNSNCSVNITSDKVVDMPALWFEFMSELVDDLQTPTTLSKQINGYNVSLEWDVDEELNPVFTPSVEKDGESAGTASQWLVIMDENGDEAFRLAWSDLTVEATSEKSFEVTYTDGDDVYEDEYSYEVDADTGIGFFAQNGVTKNGDAFGSSAIYIKCE